MESPTSPSQTSPLLLLLLFFLASPPPSSATSHGLRIDLTHIDATQNLTALELLQRAVERTKLRTSNLTAPLRAGGGEYIMELAVGTPPVAVPAVLHTGSDLIWTQCGPCKECGEQRGRAFDPSRSSTFSKLPCSSELCKWLTTRTCIAACEYYFSYSYSDDKLTKGILATETITLGSTKQVRFPRVGFGCAHRNMYHGPQQASGYVGLGRGRLSLTSQLGINKFSYCFSSFGSSKKSHLLLGSEAGQNRAAEGAVRSVRLHRNPDKPSLYFLSLKAVTVGKTHLQIRNTKSAVAEDYGNGALILDSGASLTALDYKLYQPVLKAFKSQAELPAVNGSAVGLDLCFQVPPNRPPLASMMLPELVFHFDEGVGMEFPVGNYMSLHSNDSLVCLAMCSSFSVGSVLGNFQQQNMHMLFDLEEEKLSFVKARCDQL